MLGFLLAGGLILTGLGSLGRSAGLGFLLMLAGFLLIPALLPRVLPMLGRVAFGGLAGGLALLSACVAPPQQQAADRPTATARAVAEPTPTTVVLPAATLLPPTAPATVTSAALARPSPATRCDAGRADAVHRQHGGPWSQGPRGVRRSGWLGRLARGGIGCRGIRPAGLPRVAARQAIGRRPFLGTARLPLRDPTGGRSGAADRVARAADHAGTFGDGAGAADTDDDGAGSSGGASASHSDRAATNCRESTHAPAEACTHRDRHTRAGGSCCGPSQPGDWRQLPPELPGLLHPAAPSGCQLHQPGDRGEEELPGAPGPTCTASTRVGATGDRLRDFIIEPSIDLAK